MSTSNSAASHQPPSMSPAAGEMIGSPAWTISELITLYRIALGALPATIQRFRKQSNEGGEKVVEVPIFKRDLNRAQTILKALARLVATQGAAPVGVPPMDEVEGARLDALIGKYKDGSHPSCRIGQDPKLGAS